MKRIVKCDEQILLTPGNRMFAIYDTIPDRFQTVLNSQTWESAEALAADYEFEILRATQGGDKKLADALCAERDRCVGLAKGSGY